MNIRLRTIEFMAMPALVAVALLVYGPIAQFADYHHFADSRTLLGIVNFADTASNLPFIVIGVLGVWRWLNAGAPGERQSLAGFAVFAGAICVGLGSSYYHLAPDDSRLVWDRLPIAITFMAFFVAIVEEHLEVRAGPGSLAAALAVAAASVGYWKLTGDLRLYLWTQIVPLLAIPMAMLVFHARFTHRGLYWAVFACYVLAKVFELQDLAVLQWTAGAISGHTLKHLVAAAGLGVLLWRYAVRGPTEAPAPTRRDTILYRRAG